jgi:hypothetical protein
MSELVKKHNQEVDGFDYDDTTEGKEERLSGSLLVGGKIGFSIAQIWVDRDGNKLPPRLELVVNKILRAVQKRDLDGNPIAEHTHILEPHEKWPDIEALNETCPKSEWREGPDGKLRGPFGGQRFVYFVDMQDMSLYTWPSPKDTIGSRMCINDLRDRINLTRKFRGVDVYPVVELSDTFMPTRFGGRQRPHLPVKRWITFGPSGEVKQLEAPAGVKVVEPPSTKEVTRDEITW